MIERVVFLVPIIWGSSQLVYDVLNGLSDAIMKVQPPIPPINNGSYEILLAA